MTKTEELTYELLRQAKATCSSPKAVFRYLHMVAPNDKVKLLATLLFLHERLLDLSQNTKAEESLILIIISLMDHVNESENDAMYKLHMEVIRPVIDRYLLEEGDFF